MGFFEKLKQGIPTLDITDCPDLAPILMTMATLLNGAVLKGTSRLKIKESDRGQVMHEELYKLGGGLIFGKNTITVPKHEFKNTKTVLDGHNDHRIVMALSLILSKYGGTIDGAEAVRKSYPSFFDDIKNLRAEVKLE